MLQLEILIKTLKENGFKKSDIELIKRAFEFARDAHKQQIRKSGRPYVTHPLNVAIQLAKMNLDTPTIIAGLLHDIPEDTHYTLIDIEKNFGAEVAKLVSGVSNLGKIKYRGIERFSENLRKMFISMAQDIRVILIKMADRYHNMQTLRFLPPEKQKRIALEVLEIYSPIAHRLGMGQIKGELEDLAFPYVYPEEYEQFKREVIPSYRMRIKYTNELIEKLKEELALNKIKTISVHGRSKHLYSLYKKLKRPQYGGDINRIYDLVAIRIVVNSVADCYKVLGVVHQLWTPLPGRIKDYIAQPKPNNYQSLHTSVFGPNQNIVELQIRTQEMHEQAEYGIAAHWKYKEFGKGYFSKSRGGHYKGFQIPKKFVWINELAEWQKEIADTKQLLKELKLDAFQDRILVFTPQGDVIDLPEGATPVDFAYYIHTEIGHKCVGVKINDVMEKLDVKLKSGDVVEILTDSTRKGPSQDWIQFVKTSSAKSKIRAFFAKQ